MQHGRRVELADPDRLPPAQLIEDPDFAFPAIPDAITMAMAWGVFPHLQTPALATALANVAARFPRLRAFLFTLFLAPEGAEARAYRQADGVVTHPDRAPRHLQAGVAETLAAQSGLVLDQRPDRLPRGQVLFIARRGVASASPPPQMP